MASIDYNLLPAIKALLDLCSVSAAAEALGVTQSAASQMLARARLQFADELLVRQGHRMVRTPYAQELQKRLHIWDSATTDVLRPVPFDPLSAERELLIAANDFLEMSILPQILARVAEQCPKLSFALRSVESLPLDGPDFADGSIHFTIAGHAVPDGPFEYFRLFDDHFVILARKNHSIFDKPLRLADYATYGHILVCPQGRGMTGSVDHLLAKHGLARQVKMTVSRYASLPELLRNSDLVCAVPSRFAANSAVQNHCRSTPFPVKSPQFAVNLIWHRLHNNDLLHKLIRQIFLTCAAEPEKGTTIHHLIVPDGE